MTGLPSSQGCIVHSQMQQLFIDEIDLKSGLSSFYAVFDTLFQYVQYLTWNILSTPYLLLKTTHSQSAPHIHLLDESMTYIHRIHHRVANSTAGLTSSSSCVVQMQIRKLFNDANDPKSGTPFVLRDIRHTSFLCTQCLLSWWEKMRKIWTPIKCGLWTNIYLLVIDDRRPYLLYLYSYSLINSWCILYTCFCWQTSW